MIPTRMFFVIPASKIHNCWFVAVVIATLLFFRYFQISEMGNCADVCF